MKSWAGLINTKNEKSRDIQGYLKFAITVLGPGDEQSIEEDEQDIDFDQAAVLMPPRLERQDWIVVIQALQAKDLPRMDTFGTAGIDAFVSCKLGNRDGAHSGIVTSRTPVWNQELHLPYVMPGMVARLKISLFDRDASRLQSERVAALHFNVGDLPVGEGLDPPMGLKPDGTPLCAPTWYHLYGATKDSSDIKHGWISDKMNEGLCEGTNYDGSVLLRMWKRRVAVARTELVNLPRGKDPKNSDRLKEAKKNKGIFQKLIVDEYAYDLKPKTYNSLKENIAPLEDLDYPDECDFVLRWTVFTGTNIGVADGKEVTIEVTFGPHSQPADLSNKKANHPAAKISERCVSFFPYGDRTFQCRFPVHRRFHSKFENMSREELVRQCVEAARDNQNGIASRKAMNFETMSDAALKNILNEGVLTFEMVPDVFVYASVGGKRIAYARFPAAALMDDSYFSPVWVLLKEDMVLDKIPEGDMAGQILLRMKLYRRPGFLADPSTKVEEFPDFLDRVGRDWNRFRLGPEDTQPIEYELRCHLYQACELTPADANGSLDPYVVVRCAGVKAQSTLKTKTTSPVYHETIVLKKVLLARNVIMAPDILVEVYDNDLIGSDDLAGRFEFKTLELFTQTTTTKMDGTKVTGWEVKPEVLDDKMESYWEDRLFIETPGVYDAGGKVLVSWQLIPAALLKSDPKRFEAKHEWPETVPCTIEVTVIGLCDLRPNPLPVSFPYIEFDIGDDQKPCQTKPSRQPTATNPNYLAVSEFKAELPIESKYAPNLNIKVQDVKIRGLAKMVLCTGSASLSELLPWSEEFEKQLPLTDTSTLQNVRLIAGKFETVQPPPGSSQYGASGMDDIFGSMEDTGSGSVSARGRSSTTGGAPPVKPRQKSRVLNEEKAKLLESTDDGSDNGASSSSMGRLPASVGGASSSSVALDDSLNRKPASASEVSSYGSVGDASSKQGAPLSTTPSGAAVPPILTSSASRVIANIPEDAKQNDGDDKDEKNTNEDIAEEVQEVEEAEEETDWRAKWMLDRSVLDAPNDELEDLLSFRPFHDVPLFSGKGANRKPAGSMKGYIRIIPEFRVDRTKKLSDQLMQPFVMPALPFKFAEAIKPSPYLVRVYVLRAFSLMPKDRGGTCDPYVHLKIGSKAKPIADRQGRKEKVRGDCYFYVSYEMAAMLPGPPLKLSIFDWNRIGEDELIGTTTIDLTNRWFNEQWRQCMPNKPIERRNLHHPSAGTPQGKVEMWLDIFPQDEAKKIPALVITPPPPQTFQLRVIIWHTRNVKSMDSFTNQNDLFVRCEVEGAQGSSQVKETDTHWRAKQGRGNFNFRMLYKIVVDPAAPKISRLKVSAWDRDIVSFNDAVGETVLNLEPFLLSCYHKYRKANPITADDDDKAKQVPKDKGSETEHAFYMHPKRFDVKDKDHRVPNHWISLGLDENNKPLGDILISVELVHESMVELLQVGEGRNDPNQHPFLFPPKRPNLSLLDPLGTLKEILGPELMRKMKYVCVCLCCCLLLFLITYLRFMISVFK
eukprot:c13020_g1_i1.p1 GENE.c13020_g1_i1~~c13020_g1_i1.p1  ORF type:complete len:1691 (-),score=420.75 c13020_g1_i1:43-4602(-)